MLAVTNNRIECVKVLLENGADPNICSRVHTFCSHVLCQLLYSFHISCYTQNGWSSLYSAANKGYTEIVTIILYSQAMHKLKGKSFQHLSPLNIDAQNMVSLLHSMLIHLLLYQLITVDNTNNVIVGGRHSLDGGVQPRSHWRGAALAGLACQRKHFGCGK